MSFNAEGLNAGNIVFGAAGLTANGAAVATANTVAYTINGIWNSAAAAPSIPLPAPSPAGQYTAGKYQTIPAGSKALFALTVDAAGSFGFVQSALVGSEDPAPVVGVDGDKATVGVFTVTATTADFVPGTTALGTGNSVTFYDTATMPGSSLA